MTGSHEVEGSIPFSSTSRIKGLAEFQLALFLGGMTHSCFHLRHENRKDRHGRLPDPYGDLVCACSEGIRFRAHLNDPQITVYVTESLLQNLPHFGEKES